MSPRGVPWDEMPELGGPSEPPSEENPVSPAPPVDVEPPRLLPRSALWFNFRIRSPHVRENVIQYVTGFAIRWPGQRGPILVASAEAFTNPIFKLEANQVDQLVTGMSVIDPVSKRELARSAGVLPIDDASAGNVAGNISAFWGASNGRVSVLELASEVPKAGWPVWLVRIPYGTDRTPPKLLQATTSGGDDIFRFVLSGSEKMPERSGAPLLNSAGEVVGMYSRYLGENEGYATSAREIRAYLQRAIAKHPRK